AIDPSPADQAAGFTYQIDWGDGTTQTVQGPASGVTAGHVYTGSGAYTVSVTATDKDAGTSPAAAASIAITAVALQGGNLVVGGTSGDDQISVTPVGADGAYDVVINGEDQGTFT